MYGAGHLFSGKINGKMQNEQKNNDPYWQNVELG
jgi:hypothetical protein